MYTKNEKSRVRGKQLLQDNEILELFKKKYGIAPKSYVASDK